MKNWWTFSSALYSIDFITLYNRTTEWKQNTRIDEKLLWAEHVINFFLKKPRSEWTVLSTCKFGLAASTEHTFMYCSSVPLLTLRVHNTLQLYIFGCESFYVHENVVLHTKLNIITTLSTPTEKKHTQISYILALVLETNNKNSSCKRFLFAVGLFLGYLEI